MGEGEQAILSIVGDEEEFCLLSLTFSSSLRLLVDCGCDIHHLPFFFSLLPTTLYRLRFNYDDGECCASWF